MKAEYYKGYSPSLNREMEFKVYGHGGKPFIVFPSSGGRFYEYEDFGMVEACRSFIEEGKIRLITPDSVDKNSWLNREAGNGHKVHVHRCYENYILEELVAAIRWDFGWEQGIGVTGCSMGAYHALNFFLKHPDVFDTVIAQSGIYDAGFFTGGNLDEGVYFDSPIHYLAGLEDPWFLEHYRKNKIVVSTGLGRWEKDTLRDTDLLSNLFKAKGIPAWIDYWGQDVDHDWPWWQIQIPYFLGKLAESGWI